MNNDWWLWRTIAPQLHCVLCAAKNFVRKRRPVQAVVGFVKSRSALEGSSAVSGRGLAWGRCLKVDGVVSCRVDQLVHGQALQEDIGAMWLAASTAFQVMDTLLRKHGRFLLHRFPTGHRHPIGCVEVKF